MHAIAFNNLGINNESGSSLSLRHLSFVQVLGKLAYYT